MIKKPLLIVIVGPTASGKSDLAIRMAKKFNGEIISADSRQVYRSINVGTAKIKGGWKRGVFVSECIPHFCIDMIPPQRVYTAAEFVAAAQEAIADIRASGKLSIVAGGTAFWVDALVYNLKLPEVPPNPALRKGLEKKSSDRLLAMLKKLDSRRATTIEQKNPRRLIRAIEIAQALGRVPNMRKKNPYRALWLGLCVDEKTLRQRIAARTKTMIARGLVAETKKLIAAGITQKRIREFGFEYTAVLDVIKKKINRSECERLLMRDTIRYSRRQMRWFKRNQEIHWIKTSRQAQQLVKQFLSAHR